MTATTTTTVSHADQSERRLPVIAGQVRNRTDRRVAERTHVGGSRPEVVIPAIVAVVAAFGVVGYAAGAITGS